MLIGGALEPVYQPATCEKAVNQVHFKLDYFASALHEIAHWCIAGVGRRQLQDYGYWYQPETRDISAQSAFIQVEAKPQALEWIFHRATGHDFIVSLDNPDLLNTNHDDFKLAIVDAANTYQQQGLPKRAEQFHQALVQFYQRQSDISRYAFSMRDI